MPAPTGGGRTESSSVRLAILAVVSRVRCAALRDLQRQSKASRKRKNQRLIVAEATTLRPGNLYLRWQWITSLILVVDSEITLTEGVWDKGLIHGREKRRDRSLRS